MLTNTTYLPEHLPGCAALSAALAELSLMPFLPSDTYCFRALVSLCTQHKTTLKELQARTTSPVINMAAKNPGIKSGQTAQVWHCNQNQSITSQ
jgi:chaperone required for assembly of F1-ATPase